MTIRISGRQRLLGAIAALLFAFALAPSTSARADGCSIGDVGQALVDATKTFPWACSTNFDDPYFWALTAVIGISSGISSSGGHDYISDGCSTLSTMQQDLQKGIEDAATVKKDLNTLVNGLSNYPEAQTDIKNLINSLGLGGLLDGSDDSGVVQDVSQLTSDLSSALSYLTCACNMVFSPGISAVNQDLGDCLNDGLCDVTSWLNQNVSSSFSVTCPAAPPPPPVQIDCTQDPCAAAKAAQTYCDDTGIPPSGPAITFTGVGQQPGCGGDYCFDGAYLSGQGGYFCYCPKAMQQDLAVADANQSYFVCACPQGTTALGTSGGAEYTCMCPSGVPMNADGSCPPPPPAQAQAPVCHCLNNQVSSVTAGNVCSCGCPDGQTKSGDQCVAPCARAGDVMLAGGSCCAAAQATSCGTCCPAGMRPDATGSSCVSAVAPTRKPTTPSAPMRRL